MIGASHSTPRAGVKPEPASQVTPIRPNTESLSVPSSSQQESDAAPRQEQGSKAPRVQRTLRASLTQETAPPTRQSVTLRLSPEVARALAFASSARKLNREQPWSQQDITDDALRLWLEDNGYLTAAA